MDTPDLTQLISDFKSCTPATGSSWNRLQLNDDIRFTRWPNQFPDGKKYNTSAAKAFPWAGASDARCPAADELINWDVAESFVAFWRAWIAPKAGTSEVSNYAVKLMDYLVNTVLYEQLFTEVELSAQYRNSYGWCLLHPCWETEVQLEYREIALPDLVQAAQAAGQQLAQVQAQGLGQTIDENAAMLVNLPQLIIDPSQEDQAVAALKMVYGHYAQSQGDYDIEIPPVREERLREAVKELRAKGRAKLPVPYLCKNQVAIYALKPWDEVFIKGSVTDLQKSTVFRRDWLTEEDLRAKIITQKWDPDWVEQAVKLKGKMSVWSSASTSSNPPSNLATAMSATDTTSWEMYDQPNSDMIEVIYATYRKLDEDNVPAIYLTVFHPDIGYKADKAKAAYAEHGLLEGTGGKLPYIAGPRERWHRAIATSRGLPEIVNTWQRTIKVHTDGAIDWMSIGVMPPINEYENAMGVQYVLGPAVKNTVRAGKEPKFMEVPSKGVPFAFEMIEKTERDLDAYAGRDHPALPPTRGQSKRQMSAAKFLLMWTSALQMALDLYQCWGSDEEFARVTGAPAGWLEANRKEKNLLSARLEFDIRELNPDYVKAQLEAVNAAVLPQDVAGVTNRAKWTKIQWRMINPMLARELVQEDTAASQQLFEKVQSDIALMFLGNEPKYVEMDPTAPQKLQYAQQIVASNPNYTQALQQGGRFAELMKKYAMNLQFSITEEQNKQVGAIGVKPEAPQIQ